ncbi:protein kinase domain-containing protein [Tuwongella immobilis]|uniref:Protein kinase domain-containing protein n=1 Tax=Tuwongella immobilis TaxID=692036 RepID=A0A6C2YW72_9BACT|nr:protein kinase [Tuwongella immobilis]VIP05641.1 serine threonine protein kinase : Serine/threonine protein kinase OS=Pirellula staleyi (strain ATCC 27377 / DSM 6068 / ICPB 4128) GN=Psta_4559 PE=3 SV=1: Pkinase [Tuwongella immobilis]VTS08638.1 serine threonine protein kinase : Serine/threonine protein kinase OS=Pirellula staleyi (strain ATCC 27377 / DSM 6068 / ICPB 4128) GN=Psta_4559 PE=3 SV=1: Pkinase [Tuwongella immobilis]
MAQFAPMREIAEHPEWEQLAAFSQGTVSLTEAEWIAAHLEGCPQCMSQLQTLPNDGFVKKLADACDPLGGIATALPSAFRRHPRYRLVRQVAIGAVGIVFEAVHRQSGATVAVKVLRPEHRGSPRLVQRMIREGQILGRLHHPHLVQIMDSDELDGFPFLVLEWIPGERLLTRWRRHHPLPVNQVVRWLVEAATALHHCHQQGIIHRDINPMNLLIHPTLGVKLIDFGVAWCRQVEPFPDRDIAPSATMGGTLAYLPPEQIQSPHLVGPAADWYALAATAVHLLTGRSLFGVLEESLDWSQSVERIVHAPPPDLRTLRPDLPAKLANLLQRLLAKSPAERGTERLAVATELEQCLDSQSPIPPNPRFRGRWAWPVVLGGTALLGTGIGIGLGLAQEWHRPISTSPVAGESPSRAERPKVTPKSQSNPPPNPQIGMNQSATATATIRIVGNQAGQYARIRDALADAPDDTTIRIEPGHYSESELQIDRSISLVAASPGTVRLELTGEIGIRSRGKMVLLRDLSLRGLRGTCIQIDDGTTTLEGCSLVRGNRSQPSPSAPVIRVRGEQANLHWHHSRILGNWNGPGLVGEQQARIQLQFGEIIQTSDSALRLQSGCKAELVQVHLADSGAALISVNDAHLIADRCDWARTANGHALVHTSGKMHLWLTNCQLRDSSGDGLRVSNGANVLLRKCQLTGMRSTAVAMLALPAEIPPNESSAKPATVVLERCQILHNRRAIRATGDARLTVTQSEFRDQAEPDQIELPPSQIEWDQSARE